MAVTASAITVGTTATLLSGTDLGHRLSFAIRNTGTVTIYLGGPNVTTASGYPLDAGQSLGLDLRDQSGSAEEVYGIVSSGSSTARVLTAAA